MNWPALVIGIVFLLAAEGVSILLLRWWLRRR